VVFLLFFSQPAHNPTTPSELLFLTSIATYSKLLFLVLATMGKEQRPWVGVAYSTPGTALATSPSPTLLEFAGLYKRAATGDPALTALKPGGPVGN